MTLLGSGELTSYQILGFSQSDTYDARMLAQRECDREDLFDTASESDLRKVEFKLHASQVVRDFESQVKDAREMHILICWDEGTWCCFAD